MSIARGRSHLPHNSMSPCPCNSEREYDACCGAIHRATRGAATAEELMRSRYSAFVKADIDFLRSSHDPETREEFDRESAEQWASQAEWEGFEVLRTEGGGPGDSTGVVEFVARYTVKGDPVVYHEIGDFRRVGDEWFFRDGHEVPVTVRHEQPKIGRNDPCPCGSGKKHKKCCGRS